MKRAFVQWFVLLLAYLVAAFFVQYFGVFAYIWHVDYSYMTSAIAAIFIWAVAFLGWASWNVEERPAYSNTITILGRTVAYIVTLVGLLGTVIGLMYQVNAFAHLNVQEPSSVIAFIGVVGPSLGSALLATACGIVASLGITTMNSNVEYFLDVNEHTGDSASS